MMPKMKPPAWLKVGTGMNPIPKKPAYGGRYDPTMTPAWMNASVNVPTRTRRYENRAEGEGVQRLQAPAWMRNFNPLAVAANNIETSMNFLKGTAKQPKPYIPEGVNPRNWKMIQRRDETAMNNQSRKVR